MMPRVRGVNAARIVVGRQREAVLGVRPHDHRRRLGQLDLLDQRRPARHVRDHFVAGPEERQHAVEERLLAAGAEQITSDGGYSTPLSIL